MESKLIKKPDLVSEELLVAADLCEEIGELSYSAIVRDFASSFSFGQTCVTFPDLPVNWANRNLDPFDRFIAKTQALKPKQNMELTRALSRSASSHSLADLRSFLKQKRIDKFLRRQGFTVAANAIAQLRKRLRNILTTFMSNMLVDGSISIEQVIDSLVLAKQIQRPIEQVLVTLGYATEEEVAKAQARFHKIEFINLEKEFIDESIIGLVPETVCRESLVIPIREDSEGNLVVVSPIARDFDTQEKLCFIMNRQVKMILGTRSAILEAINRHYGEIEGYSYDGPLREFVDTAIDFTDSEHASGAERNEESGPEPRQLLEPETENLLTQFRRIWTPVLEESRKHQEEN